MNNAQTAASALIVAVALTATIVLTTGTSRAQEEVPFDKVEAAVKYRNNVMDAMGGLAGAAAGRLRDGFDYGPDVESIAAALQALSSDVPRLFPKGSDFGDTRAKAEIWENWEDFKEAAEKAEKKVDGFAEAAQGGDRREMLKAFKAMGDACKNCHEDYRKEEDKS